jgi:hypothetical protein
VLNGAVHADQINAAFDGEGVGLAYDNWVGGDDYSVATSRLCCHLDAKNSDSKTSIEW